MKSAYTREKSCLIVELLEIRNIEISRVQNILLSCQYRYYRTRNVLSLHAPFFHTNVPAIVDYTTIRVLWHCLRSAVPFGFFKYSTSWRSSPWLDPRVEGSKPQWFSCFLPPWSVDSYQTGPATGPGPSVRMWRSGLRQEKKISILELRLTSWRRSISPGRIGACAFRHRSLQTN